MSNESVCRLCVSKYPEYLLKTNEQLKNERLDLLILQYLQINMTNEDNLPSSACNVCCKTLYEFDQFLIRIKSAQKKLLEVNPSELVNIKLENEDDSFSNHSVCKSEKSDFDDTFDTNADSKTDTNVDSKSETIKVKSEEPFDNEDNNSNHSADDYGNADSPPPVKSESKRKTKKSKKVRKAKELKNRTIDFHEICTTSIDNLLKSMRVLPFKCFQCNLELPSDRQLQDHWKSQHEDMKLEYVCAECNALFDTVAEYEVHYNEHDVVKNPKKYRYICRYCGKKFIYKKDFTQHEDAHLGIKRHCCTECDRQFREKKSLVTHLRVVHNKEQVEELKCNQCDKVCQNKALLKRHLRTHIPMEEKQQFQCDICQRKFVSEENLNAHQKLIHSVVEEELICEQCGKICKNKHRLAEHLNTHNARIFNCDECAKCFKSMQVLKIHKLTHSGIKMFECDVCGKKFSRRGQLTTHSTIHTGNLPYECSYCKKQFRQKYYLKVHLRQHTGERPYSCTECNHFFANDANFIKHLKGKHGLTKFSIVNKRRYPFDEN
ncbi:zinc finger protein 260-like [Chrysoperla carnea]|uniref:zinc finger protein 260-like n=1 Tax=Chrysoperla carnea TaxID=189513 RepID=UPI001D098555|nr:zinc finger protein 260-like [Chrysoperla carnea]